jgi:lysophospholipid acyltransferase (LPLAT)-like uncharacterized protein
MFKRFLQSAAVRAVIAWVAGCYLHLVALTTRWRIVGGEEISGWAAGGPSIVAFWHEALPAMPIVWLEAGRRGKVKPAVVLASRHRDGQLIGQATRYFGIGMVSGSSSRGGAEGLRALLAALKAGADVGLTPDGPRGPRRVAAAGVARLAALSGAPVLPCAASTRWAVPFNSWDRMRFPLPFGRGALVCGAMIVVPRQGWEAALPKIEAALTQALTRAERLR